jgi:hypothetical protein
MRVVWTGTVRAGVVFSPSRKYFVRARRGIYCLSGFNFSREFSPRENRRRQILQTD